MHRLRAPMKPSKSKRPQTAQRSDFSSRVVGFGNIGSRYSEVLASLSTTPPLVVPVSRRLREPLQLGHVDFEDLNDTSRPPVDITIIATATERHAIDALHFATKTRLLLIEKPVASSVEEWKRVAQNNIDPEQTRVAAPLRFLDGFTYVLDALPRLGDVMSVSVVACSWLPDWRQGRDIQKMYVANRLSGGVMRDLIHEVDYCLALFGHPLAVAAVTQSGWSIGIDSDSHAQITWRYPNFLLTISLSFLARPPERTLRIDGTLGSLRWDLIAGCVNFTDHKSGLMRTHHYPEDLVRRNVMIREILSALDPLVMPSGASLVEGLQALHAVDLAHDSAGHGGAEQKWNT